MVSSKERIIVMLKSLIQGNSITFDDYMTEYGLSKKTFKRDFNDIKYCGFNLDEKLFRNNSIMKLNLKETFESYMIPEEYRYDALIALKSYQTVDTLESSVINSLEKAWFGEKINSWFEVDYKRWITNQYSDDNFSVIKKQILNKGNIKFRYVLSEYITNSDNNYPNIIRDIVIKPTQLIYKDGSFYIKGRGKNRQEALYKWIRIMNLETSYGEPLSGICEPESVNYKNYKPSTEDNINFEFKVPLFCLWMVMEFYPESDYTIYEEEKYVHVKLQRSRNMIVNHFFQFEDNVYDIKPKYALEEYKKALCNSILKNS